MYLEDFGSFNWASGASPTLGCSIEISRDIYICVGLYVHRMPKCVGGITWPKHAHAQNQFWAVKTDLLTPVLCIYTIR